MIGWWCILEGCFSTFIRLSNLHHYKNILKIYEQLFFRCVLVELWLILHRKQMSAYSFSIEEIEKNACAVHYIQPFFCVSGVLLSYAKTAVIGACFSLQLFSGQYDLWTSAPRTQRGHLSDPVSITLDEHQALQRDKVRWIILLYSRWFKVLHNPTQHWTILTHLNGQVNSSITSRHYNMNTQTQKVVSVSSQVELNTRRKRFLSLNVCS